MKIDEKRLIKELKELREMTDSKGQGVTRFSYGEKDMEARSFFAQKAKEAGLSYRTDAVGNIYIWDKNQDMAAKERNDGKIMIGSHMDTVRYGGWLDGTYGTVGAFEVLRSLKESGKLRENIQLVIFAEEEGSNFTSTTTGSKFATGVYKEKDLDRLKDQNGISMREMVTKCGFPAYKEDQVVWDFTTIKAMLELHIEQGPILDERGKSIGIVEKVNGMEVWEFTLEGLGNHAGASPMSYRKDALVGGALAVTKVEEIAKKEDQLVATVGRLNVKPNSSNVIPGWVNFTVEVRHVDKEFITSKVDEIKKAIEEIAKEKGLKLSHKKLAESLPVSFDNNLANIIEKAAKKADLNYERMNSGAVHDASMLGIHIPAAMIFVPSIDGRSHVAYEDTKEEDLIMGVQLLLDTLLELQ